MHMWQRIGRNRVARAVLVLGSVGAVVGAGLAAAVPTARASSAMTIVGAGGRCVDVAWAQTANGTPVQLADCNGTAAQDWFHDDGPGPVRALGKCLDVAGGVWADGTRIQLFDCNGTGARQYTALLRRLNREKELRELVRRGCPEASEDLAKLLLSAGREDDLRAMAAAGDRPARECLIELWGSLGREDELRERAVTGDVRAHNELLQLLARLGRHEELRRRAVAGDILASGHNPGKNYSMEIVDLICAAPGGPPRRDRSMVHSARRRPAGAAADPGPVAGTGLARLPRCDGEGGPPRPGR